MTPLLPAPFLSHARRPSSAVQMCALLATAAFVTACSGGTGGSQTIASPTATLTRVPTAAPSATAVHTSTPLATPTATATDTPQSPQAACDALSGRSIGGADIHAATLVASSPVYPEYCKVRGTIAPQLNFEVRLPTSWSGRALFIGGGGLDGVVALPETILFNPSVTAEGYVTIGTDAGHQGSPLDGAWALDDPLAVENFADRSTHAVLGAARAIIAARYGRAATKRYFIGTSTGGREGLIAAQRWPDDFDGIVALEPVYDMTALVVASNRVAQQVFATAGGRLTAGALQTLASAVLDACDGLDGLADGIISNSMACRFDPAALRCAGPATDHCLTDAQIETVNTVHAELALGVTLANDIRSYPGWPLGNEDVLSGWPLWIGSSSAEPSSSLGFILSDQTLRFLVAHNPALDTLQFSPAAFADQLGAFSAMIDATDPDLSAFAARGGKLILWHGLTDYAVSARSTARYYERVVQTLGGAAANRFLRFYASPGVDHLSGGPGAPTTDFLRTLTAWVEDGAAPGDLISFKAAASGPQPALSRPLCRYPAYPRYDGSGDPHAAASFHCTPPS